jgi:hypothetical protein
VAEFTGKNLSVLFASNALTGNHRTFTVTEEMGLVDASAGPDAARSYVATLKDGKATLEVLGDDAAAGPTWWGNVLPGAVGSLVWGEEGTGSGQPRHTVNAVVSSRKKDAPYDDLVVYTVEFQYSGAVADDSYP